MWPDFIGNQSHVVKLYVTKGQSQLYLTIKLQFLHTSRLFQDMHNYILTLL